MGEKDDEAWEIVGEDTADETVTLPLSSTADFHRPSIHGQRRTLYYGSFSQEFFLETDTLKNLLSNLNLQKPELHGGCGLNPVETENRVGGSPSYIIQRVDDSHPVLADEGNEDELLRQQKLGHRQKDSGIDSPDYLEHSSPTEWSSLFLTECNKQFENLWSFMEARLDQIADEYERYESRYHGVEVSHPRPHTVNCIPGSMQSRASEEKKSLLEPEDCDAKSVGGDSGLGEDHLTVVKGLLEQLHGVVVGLKQNVKANVQQLSEFVMLHDRQIHSGDGKTLLQKQHDQRAAVLNRLDAFLADIDAELVKANGEDARNLHKEKERMRVFYQAMKFRPGCIILLSFLLLVASSIAVCVLSQYEGNQSVIFMRLVRSPLLIVMYFFMYGMNLMAWARNGINYVSIFSYPINGIPTPKLAFRIGSFLSVCFCSLIAAYFLLGNNYLYIADKTVSLLQWLLLLGMLINPFKMFIRSGRFAFVFVWLRIFSSPLPKVTFGDFWFADQLNSMMALFVDVEYFICYSAGTSWFGKTTELKQCTTNSYGIRPVISCLPSFWRMMQCLRCYYDTRQIKHLLNAFKYFTTFPVVVFAVIFSMEVKPSTNLADLDLDEIGWIIICWFISTMIHALYCFVWDVTQDWGLFCFHKRTILRPKLLYNSKCIYLAAIVFDFVVRFLCSIKLTLLIVYHLDSDLIYTVLVFAEIVRRFVWNFFRVEYEQVMINDRLEVS